MECGTWMRRLGSLYFHFTGTAVLLCSRMYRINFLVKSSVDLKMPRAITSRSSLLSQSSTWLSQMD